MLKGLSTAIALALLGCASPALAQQPVNVSSVSGWTKAALVNQSVTTSSVAYAAPAGGTKFWFINTGANPLEYELGTTSGVTASTTTSPWLAPGTAILLDRGANTFFAVIGVSASAIQVQSGSGQPQAAGGGSSGGGSGGAVTLASGAVSSGAYASGAFAAGAFSSGAYVAGSFAAGAIVDLGSGGSPAANTVNARLATINTTLANPFQAGGSIGNTTFASTVVDGGNVTLGSKADAATCATTNTEIACLRQIDADVKGPIPTQVATVPIGGVGPLAISSGGATPSSAIVANNTTSVAICTAACNLYGVTMFNNSATVAYLKLYNAAQGSTTCGSGTPVQRFLIPANTSGAGAVIEFGAVGVAYGTALTRCVTTGIADNDTGAPAATTYLVGATFK